jgi:hypothetical protein
MLLGVKCTDRSPKVLLGSLPAPHALSRRQHPYLDWNDAPRQSTRGAIFKELLPRNVGHCSPLGEREAVFNRDIEMRFASAASPTMRQREERDDHIIRSAAERRWRRRFEWLLCNLLDVFVQLVAYILLLMQARWVDGSWFCMWWDANESRKEFTDGSPSQMECGAGELRKFN